MAKITGKINLKRNIMMWQS